MSEEMFIKPEYVGGQKADPGSVTDNWIAEAGRSAFYQGVQSPFNGAAQLFNRTVGDVAGIKVTDMNLMDAPSEASFNSTNWYAQTVGGAAGMVLPFMMCKGAVSKLGASLQGGTRLALGETAAQKMLKGQTARLAFPLLEAGTTGAMFEGVFRPVKDDEFLSARMKNATAGLATFSALHAGGVGLKAFDKSVLSSRAPWMVNTFGHDVTRHAIAGFGAGALDAHMHSLLDGKGLAAQSDALKSGYTFAFLGGATRSIGEYAARAKGEHMAGDIVARDTGMQRVVGASEHARALLGDYGDVRLKRGQLLPGTDNAVNRTMQVVGELAMTEARSNVAPGEQWQAIADRQITDVKKSAASAMTPLEQARYMSYEADFRKSIATAQKGGLPDVNWEQNRYALLREFGVLNSLKRNLGSAHEYSAHTDAALTRWQTRWSDLVDRGQELRAQLSVPFNANHADPKGAEEYNRTMAESGPGKAKVLTDNLADMRGADGQQLQRPVLVDIGSADGFVPDAVARQRPDATIFTVDLDPHSFLGMLAKKRAYEANPTASDGFRAIPLFADGINPKLPLRFADAFSSLSNLHELISYPRSYYGQYNTENARLALNSWARSLTPDGKIIIKDFLTPQSNNQFFLEFKDIGDRSGTPLKIENELYAPEYASGRGAARFFEEFTGQELWRSTPLGDARNPGSLGNEPITIYEPIQFKGNNLQYREVRNQAGELVGIICDARTAQELMVSAQYGMRELRSEMRVNADEQYANFSVPGYNGIMRSASPLGYNLRPGAYTTRTGSDYVSHRQMYFDLKQMKDGAWQPVDLSAANKSFDVTFQGAFQKSQGSLATRIAADLLGPLERSYLFNPRLRIGPSLGIVPPLSFAEWQEFPNRGHGFPKVTSLRD